MATSQLVLEERRHRRVTFALMAGCLAAGIAVSNERGVFVPPNSLSAALAATARAFGALTAPAGPFSLLYGPFAGQAYRLPDEIAQRIINPAAAPSGNGFPGVFGAPPAAPAAPFAGAPGGAASAPAGGGAAPGGDFGGLVPPGAGGFTGVPVPLQDVGTLPPTGPGTGVTPPILNPGGGITPPGVVLPPGIVPPIGPGNPPTPPTIVIPPVIVIPPTVPPVTPPDVGPPPTPCVGTGCTPTTPVTPPTGAVPEPASWAMLILGFGIIGGLQRLVGRKVRRQAV